MYNPMAYWGQKDLIPQVLVEYGTRDNTYKTVTYKLEGKLLSASIAPFTGSGGDRTSPLTKICQDFYDVTSLQQNPYVDIFNITTLGGPSYFSQPYFCSTTSKDGLSGFGPIEAWYIDIRNNNTFPSGQSAYLQYVNKDGNQIQITIAPNVTERILTQTYPIPAETSIPAGGTQRYTVTPISKYLGNVTPYPYKDLPVNYKVSGSAGFGNYVYVHLTGSAASDSNTGISLDPSDVTLGAIVPAYNIPITVNKAASNSYFAINSVISASNYNVKRCSDNATASVSIVIGSPIYSNGNVLYLTGSNAISGCYEVTSKITSSAQYENLTVVNSYPTCSWCQNDVKFYYVSMLGGGNIGAGYTMSYIDFNGTSRTRNLSTFGNTFKFIARNGSISTTYGGTTTITELIPVPTTNVNYSVSAGGGDSTSRIHTYQSTTGEVQLIFTSGDYATSSFCAVSSSLIQSWPTNGSFPYSIVTGSAC
jgi:hypothetical protein